MLIIIITDKKIKNNCKKNSNNNIKKHKNILKCIKKESDIISPWV